VRRADTPSAQVSSPIPNAVQYPSTHPAAKTATKLRVSAHYAHLRFGKFRENLELLYPNQESSSAASKPALASARRAAESAVFCVLRWKPENRVLVSGDSLLEACSGGPMYFSTQAGRSGATSATMLEPAPPGSRGRDVGNPCRRVRCRRRPWAVGPSKQASDT
jgi:hypothetical protein